jgi:hypothetical protein
MLPIRSSRDRGLDGDPSRIGSVLNRLATMGRLAVAIRAATASVPLEPTRTFYFIRLLPFTRRKSKYLAARRRYCTNAHVW